MRASAAGSQGFQRSPQLDELKQQICLTRGSWLPSGRQVATSASKVKRPLTSSVRPWALWRPCLSFPFFFLGRTLDRNLCSAVAKCGCPSDPTHVSSAQGKRPGKAWAVLQCVALHRCVSRGSQHISLAQPAAEERPA